MIIWTFLLRITHIIISQIIADSSWIILYKPRLNVRANLSDLACRSGVPRWRERRSVVPASDTNKKYRTFPGIAVSTNRHDPLSLWRIMMSCLLLGTVLLECACWLQIVVVKVVKALYTFTLWRHCISSRREGTVYLHDVFRLILVHGQTSVYYYYCLHYHLSLGAFASLQQARSSVVCPSVDTWQLGFHLTDSCKI
jgi:hypothetical protein